MRGVCGAVGQTISIARSEVLLPPTGAGAQAARARTAVKSTDQAANILLVRQTIMIIVMTCKVTGSCPVATVFKPKFVISIREYDGRIEVYQVCVAVRVTLREADAVRIVADTTRSIIFADMQAMLRKALIGKNTVAIVT